LAQSHGNVILNRSKAKAKNLSPVRQYERFFVAVLLRMTRIVRSLLKPGKETAQLFLFLAHIGYQMKIAHLSNASDGFLRGICVAPSLFRYEPTKKTPGPLAMHEQDDTGATLPFSVAGPTP